MTARKAREEQEIGKIVHALDARTVAIVALAGDGAEKEPANDLVSMMLGILAEESEHLLECIEPQSKELWAQALRLKNRCNALQHFFYEFIDAKHAGVEP